ncbi:hypothetical protein ACRWHE_25185, partial [Escherichia coli]
VTLKMPAFEWVHVQLHQQKGMISLSPPTICNSARHLHDDNGSEPIESLPLLMPTNRGKGPLKELSDNSSEIIQSLPLSA